MADTKTIQYATAAQVLMILWAVLPFTRDTAGTQPLLTCEALPGPHDHVPLQCLLAPMHPCYAHI